MEILWNSTVSAILHEDTVTGVAVLNKHTGETTSLPCSGVFVAVGTVPESGLFKDQVETDEAGYVLADETTQTSLPGVYPAILAPRDTYADPAEWDVKARDLAGRFVKNFVKYTGNDAGKALVAAGPTVD